MSTRYPSRQEVEEHQRAELDRLQGEKVFAEYETSALPPIYYRMLVGDKGQPATKPDDPPASPLLQEHARFLRQVGDHPSEGLASHYRALGVGIEKGNELLRELKAAGCVLVREEKSTHAAGGRPRKVVVLTPQGTQMLGAYEQRTGNT